MQTKRIYEKKMCGNIICNIEDKSLYREFYDSSESQKWGNQYYGSWATLYKEVMQSSKGAIKIKFVDSTIECYCGYSYREINQYLRFGIDIDSHHWREMSDILVMVLCSAPRIPCNILVYRVVKDDFIIDFIELNKCGIPIQEKGFMSTSLLKNIVSENGPYSAEKNLLKIYVDKETIGLYVNSVTARTEEELLLYPKWIFKIS